MTATDMIQLGVMSLADADRISYMMLEKGVKIEKLFNEATCSSGSCGASVEVWVHAKDATTVAQTLEDYRQLQLSHIEGEDIHTDSVFDPSKDTAVCPACSHEFSTELKICPDCGLHIG